MGPSLQNLSTLAIRPTVQEFPHIDVQNNKNRDGSDPHYHPLKKLDANITKKIYSDTSHRS
jgi:hypothetical protein